MAKRTNRRRRPRTMSGRRGIRGTRSMRGLRGRSLGGRRLGSMIRVRRTKGLGQLSQPSSLMGSIGPALLGIFATGATAIGLRMMQPKTETQMKLMENAPWIGGLVGTVAALLVGMTSGRPAAWGTAAGSTGATLLMAWSEYAAKARLQEQVQQVQNGNGGGEVAGFRGRRMGAIVMEPHASRGYGAGPLGAIVPEYGTPPNVRGLGAYGDQVALRGRSGNVRGVNAGAFGTPGFALNGRR